MLIYYLYMYWGVFLNLCEEASKEGSCRKIRGFSTKHDFSQIDDLQYSSMFDPRYSIFNVLPNVWPTIFNIQCSSWCTTHNIQTSMFFMMYCPRSFNPSIIFQRPPIRRCVQTSHRGRFSLKLSKSYISTSSHTIMSFIRRDSSGISKCSSLLKISFSRFAFFSTFVDVCRFVQMFQFFTFSPVSC